MSIAVKILGVTKAFDSVVAVDDFNLQIVRGEMMTLLGPSGCGKTTVLRMLAGFETPTSGLIEIQGRDVTHLPPNQRNCAMVFQSYALFPHLSVEDNIRYGLKLRKIRGAEANAKFEKIVAVTGLRGYEKRRPSALSGGQQQRVALARALIVEPELLLFDEPLSNLDAKLRESMRNEIRRIQKELSITSVYVTHDQTEAMAISDRVVVMNRSKIVQVGTALQVYSRPSSAFVADFMGASNILKARFVSASPGGVKMKLADYEFEALPTNASRSNPDQFVIRPEQISVAPASEISGLSAKVLSDRYLGAHFEYDLRLDDGQTIIARIDVSVMYQPKVGDTVSVRFKDRTAQAILAG